MGDPVALTAMGHVSRWMTMRRGVIGSLDQLGKRFSELLFSVMQIAQVLDKQVLNAPRIGRVAAATSRPQSNAPGVATD
jgi:hypothetical protein